MKKYLLLGLVSTTMMSFAQNSNMTIKEFEELQLTPNLSSSSEVYDVQGTNWERLYGETEFILTPKVTDIPSYQNSFLSNHQNLGSSHFSIVKVPDNSFARDLLQTRFINVPNYISDSVLVYLPKTHLSELQAQGLEFSSSDYGGTEPEAMISEKEIMATIYTEGFEVNSVPGGIIDAQNGAVNCGWKDVSCFSHSGSWSAWCAGNGPACNTSCTDYVNDMVTSMWSSSFINVAGYSDLWFRFWLEFDLYNIGSNDELVRYYDIGGGWQLSAASYTSVHANDEAGWNEEQFYYAGAGSVYAFQFSFLSNGTGTSFGVYVDDIELSGTANVGISENDLTSINVYPVPTSNEIHIEGLEFDRVKVLDLNGRIVADYNNLSSDLINVGSLPVGTYLLQIFNEFAPVTERIVIE